MSEKIRQSILPRIIGERMAENNREFCDLWAITSTIVRNSSECVKLDKFGTNFSGNFANFDANHLKY